MVVMGPRRNPIGARLTVAEQKALDIEAKKTVARWGREITLDIDAFMLYTLHTEFGFGRDRLRRFYDAVVPQFEEIFQWYEAEDTKDAGHAARSRLKHIGVDLEAWEKEKGEYEF